MEDLKLEWVEHDPGPLFTCAGDVFFAAAPPISYETVEEIAVEPRLNYARPYPMIRVDRMGYCTAYIMAHVGDDIAVLRLGKTTTSEAKAAAERFFAAWAEGVMSMFQQK